MGVRGLTTYVNYHQDVFLKVHHLHDSNLVIDGSSLAAQLYRNSNCFSAFGGDYDKYATYVRNFFKNLKKCNITSYVILDGSYETRKLKTVYQRLKSKIYGASRLDPVSQSSLQIFPLFLRDTFKEVLKEMKVAYTVCELEADNEIAAMSRRLGCPVLSFDSDFFIYNVMYVPFNMMDNRPVPIEKDGLSTHAMYCKMFRAEYLVKKIGINPDMMPLLATLLGNDYVQKQVFKQFFSHLKLPKSKSNKNEAQRTIQAVLNWLENENLESAIEKIIGRLKKSEKSRVLFIIKKSIDAYNCTECPSLKHFDLENVKKCDFSEVLLDAQTAISNEMEGNNDSENDDNNLSDDRSSDDSEDEDSAAESVVIFPNWLSNLVRNNILLPIHLNLYTLHTYFCSPQAEDYTDEDACLCVLPILRYIFDILTDFSQEHFTYVSRENCNQYKRILVGEEYAISRPIDKSYSEITAGELNIYFQHFINEKLPKLDLTIIDLLPSNFRLAFLSILWWVSNCNVAKGNVHSLLLSYIMLDVLDGKTGTFRGHHFFTTKFAKKLEEMKQRPPIPTEIEKETLFLNKNKVLYEDSLIACSVLLQHFELSKEIQKKPRSYDTKIMHSLAQYQCTLLQLNCLNCISNNVFENTKYSNLFNGTFVYNLACKLQNQMDPCAFVEQHIKGAYTVIMFYKSLCYVFDKCVELLGLQFAATGKKRRRRRKIGAKDLDENIGFLANEFASEVII